MSDIICITNRNLCKDDFLVRIENIAKAKPKAIILREKDLSESEYTALAEKVMKICRQYNIKCILHSFADAAISLKCDSIHLPMHFLLNIENEKKMMFKNIGTSCHSVEDAISAEKLGCTYIIAGHIFETDCKKGVAPRGLEFLKNICGKVHIPVYAIGGIGHKNFSEVIKAGAKGGCVMSGLMQCKDINKYMEAFKVE